MIAVPIDDASAVADARRAAVTLAQQNGFGDVDAGRVALVATELGTNIVKHGGGGQMLLGTYDDDSGKGVEILALDRGPGMGNVEACLRDGYSSSGTAGNGLGAIIRQSNLVDIASWPGHGTGVLARIEPGRARPGLQASHAAWGAVAVPMPGEEVCGDSWSVIDGELGRTLFVADGLGHGQEAAEASVEAVRLFRRFSGHQVPTLLDYIHGGLRATRGAAVSIAKVNSGSGKVIFAGVGNVAGLVGSNGSIKRMVSMPGTAGHNARKIQAFEYPFEDDGLVILHSDGLSTGLTPGRYPSLDAHHPTLIAGILYRDFARGRDDATVLVGKWGRPVRSMP